MDIVVIFVIATICVFIFLRGLLRRIKFYMDGEKSGGHFIHAPAPYMSAPHPRAQTRTIKNARRRFAAGAVK